jgi:hypothetical protein
MRELDTNRFRGAFPGRIPPEKALGMRKIGKLFDIPIKTRKRKYRRDCFGVLSGMPLFPQLIALWLNAG